MPLLASIMRSFALSYANVVSVSELPKSQVSFKRNSRLRLDHSRGEMSRRFYAGSEPSVLLMRDLPWL